MSQYEPSPIQILDSRQNDLDNGQQFLEVGSDTYVGTQDGMEYALLTTSDKHYEIYEVPSNRTLSVSSSYSDSYQSNTECNDLHTPSNKFQSVQFVTVKKESTPCRGQGDESGNSILSTPDSTTHHNPDFSEGNAIQIDDGPRLTYTTLMTKQEQKVDTNLCNTNYIVPANYFQFPTPLQAPVTSKTAKCTKSHQKLQLTAPGNFSPRCSPIPHRRGRGRGQRKQRQVVYQLRYPFMHSTPTSTYSSSVSTVIPSGSSEVSTSSEESLEYPRVPHNTPTSGNDDSCDNQKTLNIQWIPQIETQMADYIQMDPRESHNEKERKRRLRIKNACQFMKNLLPRVCNKKDNATVFENAVHFIAFMRENVGSSYDMEFLEKTCSTMPCIKTEF